MPRTTHRHSSRAARARQFDLDADAQGAGESDAPRSLAPARLGAADLSRHLARAALIRQLALSVALAIAVTWVSAHLHDRIGQQVDQAEIQIAILSGEIGQYLPQWQGRVLFPMCQVLVSQLVGVSQVQAFVALRYLSLAALFLIAFRVAGERVALTLALALILSFNHGWQTPTDALDMIAFVLGTYWAMQGRFEPLAILTLVASANRESALFLPLVWAGANYQRVPWRTLAGQTGGLLVASMIVLLALKWGTGGIALPDMAGLSAPNPDNQPHAMTLVLAVGLAALSLSQGWPSRGLAIISGLIVLVSMLGGTAHELRLYLPAVTVWMLGSIHLDPSTTTR